MSKATTDIFDLLEDAQKIVQRAQEGIKDDDRPAYKRRVDLLKAVETVSDDIKKAITETRNQIGREYEPGPRVSP